MKPQTFIFIGRSGCGKGTQIELIQKYLAEKAPDMEIENIGTGKELRKFWENEKGYSRDRSWEIREEGELQPEFLIIYMWGKVLMDRMNKNDHLIFDGSPRRLNEAEVLDSALDFYEREETHVINLDVSKEWSKEKLLGRGRKDDTEEQIEKRLAWYENDVIPTLEYLKNNPKYNFINIKGEQGIEEVYQEIIKKVFGEA